MKITGIRMKKFNDKLIRDNWKLLATASIQFDNCFVVHGLRLIELPTKRFVSFPVRRIEKYVDETNKNVMTDEDLNTRFEFADIAHPTNSDFRKYIETELFNMYDTKED